VGFWVAVWDGYGGVDSCAGGGSCAKVDSAFEDQLKSLISEMRFGGGFFLEEKKTTPKPHFTN